MGWFSTPNLLKKSKNPLDGFFGRNPHPHIGNLQPAGVVASDGYAL